MKISVSIPTRRYLKKYLAKKTNVEPFDLRPIGCHISAIILEPIKKGYIPPRSEDSEGFDENIEFTMNPSIARENKFHIDPNVIYRIDGLLRSLFDDELLHWVNRKRDEGDEIQTAVAGFLDYYQLHEDDIALETVIKRYYRHRYPEHWKKYVRRRNQVSGTDPDHSQMSLFG